MSRKHCATCNLWFEDKDLADAHYQQNPAHKAEKALSRWAFGITVDQPLYTALLGAFTDDTKESLIGLHIRETLRIRGGRVEFFAHRDDLLVIAKTAYSHRSDKAWPQAMDLFNAISSQSI